MRDLVTNMQLDTNITSVDMLSHNTPLFSSPLRYELWLTLAFWSFCNQWNQIDMFNWWWTISFTSFYVIVCLIWWNNLTFLFNGSYQWFLNTYPINFVFVLSLKINVYVYCFTFVLIIEYNKIFEFYFDMLMSRPNLFDVFHIIILFYVSQLLLLFDS